MIRTVSPSFVSLGVIATNCNWKANKDNVISGKFLFGQKNARSRTMNLLWLAFVMSKLGALSAC